MINHILIPTDFSKVADNALTFAVKLAEKCNARLSILHIKQVPLTDPSYPADMYQLYMEETDRFEKEQTARIKAEFLNTTSIQFQFHSSTGFVGDEVVNYTSNHDTDLIVMGTTGASGLAELLVGSNAASVIGKSHVPVLIIPPGYHYKNIDHILYATDYNEPEFPSVARMMYFAELYGAKVTVLHIKTENDHYFNSENNFFSRNKSVIAKEGVTVINIEDQDVIESIDRFTSQLGIDMLVMAKHNRSFFDRLFHRSLSKRMAYHTRIPLLVLHK